jgi:hypothetical protein
MPSITSFVGVRDHQRDRLDHDRLEPIAVSQLGSTG